MSIERIKTFWRSPSISTPTDRIHWLMIIGMRILVVGAIIWMLLVGEWASMGISILALVSTFVPTFVERRYAVHLPIEYHLVVVLFLFASIFLGEVGGAYDRFWWWDLVLHIGSGAVLAFIGFLILYVLQTQKKIKMSPGLIAFFSFCVAITAGVFWEIFEFLMDVSFGLNMQKGNTDTMEDLIVDAFGAFVIALAARAYYKNKLKSPIAKWINRFVQLNPRLFEKVTKTKVRKTHGK